MIEAAGAVLWRRDGAGIEVAVIGRPKYGDWTLPKGKLDDGETALEAALREVEEETGQRARPGDYLGETRYLHRGRDKVVSYWSMEALGGDFVAGDEVDEVRWLPLDEASAMLSYDRDRELLDRFRAGVQP